MVTGGTGFIGSHIVDELVRRGNQVIVYDNLSTGFREHLTAALSGNKVKLVEGNILDNNKLIMAMKEVSTVFHLAANADVRSGRQDTLVDIRENLLGTHSVLEAMRLTGASEIIFTSSATVYGEPSHFPTRETYAPLQTSLYGASKFGAEAIIQSYSEYFDIRCYIFRFVSWLGERYSHGVIYDFINKLRENPTELEILGDGEQKKSYLHVDDGIAGIFLALDQMKETKNVINLGHVQYMDVKTLASVVVDEMKLPQVTYRFTGGSRGWVGDSPFVHLDISKMQHIGFHPKISIEHAVRRTARYLLDNLWLLDARNRWSV